MGSPSQRRRRKALNPLPKVNLRFTFFCRHQISVPPSVSQRKRHYAIHPPRVRSSCGTTAMPVQKKKNLPSLYSFHWHSIIIKIQSAQPGPHSTAQKKKKKQSSWLIFSCCWHFLVGPVQGHWESWPCLRPHWPARPWSSHPTWACKPWLLLNSVSTWYKINQVSFTIVDKYAAAVER